MKLQDVEKKFPPFDKPAGEAAYLISTGKFEKYVPPYNAPVPDLKWFAQAGDAIEDIGGAPRALGRALPGVAGDEGLVGGRVGRDDLGGGAGGSGVYSLSNDATLSVSGAQTIGRAGSATMNQAGGSSTATTLFVAADCASKPATMPARACSSAAL